MDESCAPLAFGDLVSLIASRYCAPSPAGMLQLEAIAISFRMEPSHIEYAFECGVLQSQHVYQEPRNRSDNKL